MNTSIEIESSKRLRGVVPSRMRREIDIHVSCNEVLKVKPKTIIYTLQGGNEENFDLSYGAAPTEDEVAFSAHATIPALTVEQQAPIRYSARHQERKIASASASNVDSREQSLTVQPSGVVGNKVDSGEGLSSVNNGVVIFQQQRSPKRGLAASTVEQ
nr:uncharacterized protein LOC109150426 [Ipomoea trifida]GMC99191.1 uncharacterized protein LOC109150426 [Ipomoea batatas]